MQCARASAVSRLVSEQDCLHTTELRGVALRWHVRSTLTDLDQDGHFAVEPDVGRGRPLPSNSLAAYVRKQQTDPGRWQLESRLRGYMKVESRSRPVTGVPVTRERVRAVLSVPALHQGQPAAVRVHSSAGTQRGVRCTANSLALQPRLPYKQYCGRALSHLISRRGFSQILFEEYLPITLMSGGVGTDPATRVGLVSYSSSVREPGIATHQ